MKLASLNLPDVHATSIDGLYVRDIPLSAMQEIEKNNDSAEIGYIVLSRYVCDENGEPFEDLTTREDVDKLGVKKLTTIMEAVHEVLDVQGKSSSRTANGS